MVCLHPPTPTKEEASSFQVTYILDSLHERNELLQELLRSKKVTLATVCHCEIPVNLGLHTRHCSPRRPRQPSVSKIPQTTLQK